jgi:hypothetical protein
LKFGGDSDLVIVGAILALVLIVACTAAFGTYGGVIVIAIMFGLVFSNYQRNKKIYQDLQLIKDKLGIQNKDDFAMNNKDIEEELEVEHELEHEHAHEKPGYHLIFEDDFQSTELDRTKWLPFYLPQWSNREASRANYRIQDGLLILQITEDQLPWCPEFNGQVKVSNFQTGVFSGPLNSSQGQHRFSKNCAVREEQAEERLFTPQYGYVEIRAKGTDNPNNVFGFWMIGFEDVPHRSAEICPFELKSWNVKENTSTIGFGLHPFGDPTIKDEFFEKEFDFDATQFHTYAVDWTPEGVDFYIDNVLIYQSQQSPNYPMQLMLNIYEIPANESGSKQATSYPSEFIIDYIRCYQMNEKL